MNAGALADRIRPRYPDVVVARDEATVVVDRGELLKALVFLGDDEELAFDFLADLAATDWPGQNPRYWLAYDLLSVRHLHRMRVKVGLPEDDPTVATVTSLFPTANWHEREMFDLYGIEFEGHPDLTRILLPDDWEGHPMRRTEELGGVDTRFHGAFIPPVDQRTT